MPEEVGWRLAWIFFAATLIAYVAYLFFGSALSATEEPRRGRVIVVDSVVPGIHSLRGVIVVPSECHSVSHKVRQETDTRYRLDFSSWQEPYRDCPQESALHAFKATAFAPALGVTFVAFLDEKPLDIHVVSSYETNNEKK